MKQNIIKVKNTGENMTPVIYDIFASLDDSAENIIEFEKGTYNFYRAGSINRMLYSSSRKACDINIIFDVIGKKNLTIDGNGADFIFRDRVNPFYFLNCENITLKNINMEYAFLRYAYADIIDVRDDGFLINIDESIFDYNINEDKNLEFVCGEDVISTKYKKISTQSIGTDIRSIVYLYVGDNEARRNPAARHVNVDAVKQGNNIFMKYRDDNENLLPFPENSTICLAYDNEREAHACFCESCKNILIDNLSIYRNGGMGLVFDLCENVSINRYKMAIKEGRREYFSSTADATFITNCAGNFSLTNSYIRDTYDDAINLHGYYLKVDKVLSDTEVKLKQGNGSHNMIPFLQGDTAHISGGEKLDFIKTVLIKNVRFDEDRVSNIVFTLDSTEGLEPDMLFENRGRMPKVLIENNTIINCPHMRLSAPEMIIRNNNLNLTGGDIYIDDLATFWQESGAVENVLITGNTFGESRNPNIVIGSCRPEGSNQIHDKITVKGNTFKMPRDKGIMAKVVREFIEEGNVFGA